MKIRLLFSFFAMILLTSVKAQITTVGLIGSATPGGWDVDTSMVQDINNPDLWTLDILLVDGEAKFRANDDWGINWGDTDFPVGVGLPGGANIPVKGGMTHVTFNSSTGAYYFEYASDIGIIGSATPFGWDSDVNLYQDTADANLYTVSLELSGGEAKFRQDDDWAVNWGATDFPSGIGQQNGPNIPIAVGGDYNISFNKSTGEYNFVLTSFATVGLIGDATAGGWSIPTAMASGSSPGSWTVSTVLVDGGVLFTADNGVATWGGTDFPSGTATLNGDTIDVPAGRYLVNFNTSTLAYEFLPVIYYQTVGIIGDATPGGWDNDTDMELNPLTGDSSDWYLRVVLTDGEAKFRADNDWPVNWGAGDFPSGIALRDGANIPVTAGEYKIYFNTFTGQYGFVLLQVFNTVGIVGPATPLQSWDVDVDMTKDANDENLWKLATVNLTDGEMKFRAEDAWTFNWGATDFPTGTGTQDGPNIPVVAGTYGITINTDSGEYAFGDPLTATHDLLEPSSVKTWPNPATETLNIDVSAVDMKGEVTLQVYDVQGKLVLTDVKQANPQLQLNVAGLQDGYYSLQITNGKYIIGKKFVVNK